MALFTDGNIATLEDLGAQDCGVMVTAGVENIDLNTKLALAQEELGVELTTMLPRLGASGPSDSGLGRVVVTSPLRLWHVFHTLELIYRDAYNNQLNDRYKGKWDQYRELSHWAERKLLETGVGIAADAVPRAVPPVLSRAQGSSSGEATYFAAAAWVNSAGEEGAASEFRSDALPAGSSLVVATAGAPANVRGWNVYIGTSDESMTLQNELPLRIADAWTQTGDPTSAGKAPGKGQQPSYLRALPRVIQRG